MDETTIPSEHHRPPPPPRRPKLTVALGNARRELAVLATLEAWDEFDAEVCVHATELLDRARIDETALLLLSSELPGLDREGVQALARTRLGARTVFLVIDPGARQWAALGLPSLLPLDAQPDAILTALAAVAQARERPARARRAGRAARATAPDETLGIPAPGPPFSIIAVASGAGSPGRSTVALGLAVALGAVAPTVLVDADLAGPSIAALVDANPRRNLFQVAYARPDTSAAWTEALDRALQPLGPRSPHGRLLCGLASPAMRAGVSTGFLDTLLGELRGRFRHVILDLGADLTGTDAALHRVALASADQILLVTTPDLADLLRARIALADLDRLTSAPRERVALMVNRHDRRRHQGRREIEWGLGRSLAALVPYDHAGVERAKQARHSVVLDGRSPAGRGLLELASRIHGGGIALPPEAGGGRWRRFLGLLPGRDGSPSFAGIANGRVRGRGRGGDGD